MGFPLFISMLKRNRNIIFVCTLLLVFYILAVIGIFPSGMDIAKQMPKTLARAYGVEENIHDLGVFLGSGFYGISFIMFLLIYCVLTATRLVARLVDQGSIGYLLSTPASRTLVTLIQACVLVFGLFFIVMLTFIAGLVGIYGLIENPDLSMIRFFEMNLIGFLLFFVVSGYSFFFSCLFDDEKRALAASGLISVIFFLLNSLAKMGQDLEWMKYLTPFTLFNPTEIAKGEVNVVLISFSLITAGLLLFSLAITIFRKRDLPL